MDDKTLNWMKRLTSGATASCALMVLLVGVTGCPTVDGCLDDASCDNGVFCDGAETCDVASGVCAVGEAPCAEGELCVEATSGCIVTCETDADCDDGNECTDEVCNTDTNTCVRTNNTGACEDGDDCTENDVCAEGDCAGTAIADCCAADADCAEGETCVDGNCIAAGPPEFEAASATRGGSLYDKWWAVLGLDAPTEDHPRWAWQSTNDRTGGDTWRCKECHGWDYKGADGAYAEGSSHFTGFTGIFGTTRSAQEVFDSIKTSHGFGEAGVDDDSVWDLAKFVLEGQIDTDDIIDGDAFTGSADAGQVTFESTCLPCHGADGLSIPPGADADHDEWVGKIANENPWEFQHKLRFGQPGTPMPAQAEVLTLEGINDLATYAQTLPVDLP